MGVQGTSQVATLPKSRHLSRRGQEAWSDSQIHPVAPPAKEPVVSASSSLLGLQARASTLPSEPGVAEPGVLALLSRRLKVAAELLRWVGRWWLAADFHRCQLPILVLALGVWAVTARSAWQSQESATPLLRESISHIRQEQARAAAGSTATTRNASSLTVRASSTNNAPLAVPSTVAPAGQLKKSALPVRSHGPNGGPANGLIASIRSWFSAEPATPERVKGNPRRHVWVDLKTGLYYCPGADYYGYGGRDRGKVMSQRNAEYEYFQPATGAPCE
jgi:hypothetical protein